MRQAGGARRPRPLRYGTGESYGIPYRTLLPRGLENVLTAGRTSDRSIVLPARIDGALNA